MKFFNADSNLSGLVTWIKINLSNSFKLFVFPFKESNCSSGLLVLYQFSEFDIKLANSGKMFFKAANKFFLSSAKNFGACVCDFDVSMLPKRKSQYDLFSLFPKIVFI